jgi:hypothetical protein
MSRDDRLSLAAVAGVWSARMARDAGFSADAIKARRGSAEWQDLRRGTYAFGGVVPSAVMRAAAAVLAAGGSLEPAQTAEPPSSSRQSPSHPAQSRPATGRPLPPPRVVAAGRTAARAWNIPLVDDEDPAKQRFEAAHDDVIRSRGRTTHATLHSREIQLSAQDVVWLLGVPVLSPLRTLADLAVVLRQDALVAALDFALHTHLVELTDLEAAAAVSRRGCVVLRAALALTDARAESPHESLTRLVVKPVLPNVESQVRVFDRSGRLIARLDLGDEELRLGVESDGAAFHSGRAAEDRRRDARTGWTIERVSWYETRREQEQLRRRILATAATLRSRAA